MKSLTSVVGLLAAKCWLVNAQTPIAKVIQMLADLEAKIIKDGEASQKQYKEFAEWCEDRSRTLSNEITTGNSEVGNLKAGISKDEAAIQSLTMRIEDLGNEIRIDEADLNAATGIRTKEAEIFSSTEKELMSTIDVLRRTIAIIEREMKKGASMLQFQNAASLVDALTALVKSTEITSADASKLTALIQSSSDDSDSDVGAPAATVYASHSGGILQTLSDLLDKAEEQLGDLRKTESADNRNFEILRQSLKDEIAYNNKELDEAKKNLAASGESKSAGEGDLGMTSKELSADISTKEDLHHTCMTKAEDFEAEVKSRSEELKALAEAKKVLQDNTAGANAINYGSFLQVAAKITSGVDLANLEAVHIIRDLARKEHSPVLAQLAQRMDVAMQVGGSDRDDQFAKVKGLIREMISKLEGEADADASEKTWCDRNLADTRASKSEKNSQIEKLTTRMDTMAARSSQLKSQVAALQQSLAELAKSQADLNKMRASENSEFVADKADMEQGLEGVKLALKILNEYYAADNKAHEAATGAGQVIIGLLEVIESDLSKGLAEMNSDEEMAVAAFERQTKENEIERTTKEQSVKYMEKESTDLDRTHSELSSDRSTEQTQLDAVNEYLGKLEKRCVAKAETYAERKARFEAELAGLKEALRVLNDEAAALLQRTVAKRRLRGIHKL